MLDLQGIIYCIDEDLLMDQLIASITYFIKFKNSLNERVGQPKSHMVHKDDA